MDEDVSVRALIIGAGLLISIATISLVLAYYNTAKTAARSVGTGIDYNVRYRNDIEQTLLKANNSSMTLSAQEVINLINYFENDQTGIQINLKNFKIIDNDGNITSVNSGDTNYVYVNSSNKVDNVGNIFSNMDKTASYSLAKSSDGKVLTITQL